MTINSRATIYLIITAFFLIIAYLGRDLFFPFIMALGFAYVLNPLVSVLSERVKLPRSLAVSLIYLALISGLAFLILLLGTKYIEESDQFMRETRTFFNSANGQISGLPVWAQPIAADLLSTARNSTILSTRRISSALPAAISRLVNILVFLVAAFYFLKDGHKFRENFVSALPRNSQKEVETILGKINQVLGNYLRAQLLLILIMSTLTFVVLSFIGVRYALSVAIFTGIAETVPFVGPVVAAIIAMLVAYGDGVTRLAVDPVMEVVFVGLAYTILRQLEDYFIIPQVLGHMIKLHPLVILFAALFGGHLFGIGGVIIAVPMVATFRIILDHALELANKKAP